VNTPIALDFSGGPAKYKRMASEYDSIVLRGTTDVAKMPVAGTFFSEGLRSAITQQLAAENIVPRKIYFSGDDWEEFGSFGLQTSKSRRVFATFTYRRAEQCFYGIAEVTQNYDFMQSNFGESEIKLQKDLAVPCSEAN